MFMFEFDAKWSVTALVTDSCSCDELKSTGIRLREPVKWCGAMVRCPCELVLDCASDEQIVVCSGEMLSPAFCLDLSFSSLIKYFCRCVRTCVGVRVPM